MPKTIEIKQPSKLRDVLGIFSALDAARWSNTGNYNLINYCGEDFSPDEKLLTHWLCYITDRQTAFQRVWEVGGYVISHLVRAFTKGGTLLDDHLKLSSGEEGTEQEGLRLECPLVRPNPRLRFYKSEKNPVKFASRYMPSDALSIYRTLLILDCLAGRSFARFVYLAVNGEAKKEDAVRKLAAALDFLTYADIGNVSEDSVQARMTALRTSMEEDLNAFRRDRNGFIATLSEKFERDPFKKKRLWCSIRDYLKSPEFNLHLVAALEKIDRNEAHLWRRENIDQATLAAMELPGDVWNNNIIFRDGLFSPHLGATPKTWDMPRTIRAIHTQMAGPKAAFYPEQLDVTFDFVPRMCANLQCHRCVFGGGIDKLCHQQRGLYCPVILAACGYFSPCDPDNCTFKSDSVRGLCQSSIAK
jgi:hypothetical protein